MDEKLQVRAGQRKILAETAFLACISNDTARARQIAAGLEAVAPHGAEAAIAYALADLTDGDPDGAMRRLRPLADAGDPHALAFLGLSLKVAGRAAERDQVLARIPPGDRAVDDMVAAIK